MSKFGAFKEKMKQKMGKAEAGELPPELQEQLEKLAITRNHYDHVTKVVKQSITTTEKNIDSGNKLGEAFVAFGLEQHGELGESLCRFGELQKSLEGAHLEFNKQVIEQVQAPLNNFVKNEIEEARAGKKAHEKAALLRDAQVNKVADLNKKPEKNASKIPEAETKLETLTTERDALAETLTSNLAQTEARKEKQVYTVLHAYLVAQTEYFKQGAKLLEDMEDAIASMAANASE
eukprot:TRINITY_DN40414_c0_g1_i1.p1 TRINITY_DN40414_c0_g1~~TRINITY_DN40414_c0_g1_i1.p1  ORF type:complete len:254 (+),score=76.20 TRINITY_DN40414_c0_g1_i1:62-763(+)